MTIRTQHTINAMAEEMCPLATPWNEITEPCKEVWRDYAKSAIAALKADGFYIVKLDAEKIAEAIASFELDAKYSGAELRDYIDDCNWHAVAQAVIETLKGESANV